MPRRCLDQPCARTGRELVFQEATKHGTVESAREQELQGGGGITPCKERDAPGMFVSYPTRSQRNDVAVGRLEMVRHG